MSRNGALNIAYAIRRNRAGGGRLYRAEGGEAEFPAWMNADTLGPVSGPQDEMTRALPDYETRDPGELAMLRHREMVRPQAGRQDFPMEHLANMASAGAMLTPAGYVLAPEMAVGRAIGLGAQYAPRLTTAALAGVGAMAPSMTEGAEGQYASLPKDPKDIMALQAQLRAAGYPIEKIDGVINPGGPTERAFRQFQADQAAKRAEELKRQELETQQGANTATLETARANQATAAAKLEADRLKAEKDERDLARKQAGDERIRELDKNLPLSSRIMRDYSGPAGMVAGMVGGSLGRWFTQSKADKAIKETANAGNAIMAEDVALGKKGAEAALARATRANAFWRSGGAKEVPFLMEPGTAAKGFTANPRTTPLNNTYSPQIHPAVEAATAAPAALEWGVSNHYKNKWEEELHDAQKALSEDQSEANIQRVNKAKDNVGLFTGLERFGQTALGIQAVGGVGSRFMPKGPHMRPNMQPAEQEQGSLQEMIRKAAATAEKKAAKEAVKSAPRKAPPILPSTPALTVDAARARNGANIPTQAQGGGIRSPMDIAYAIRRQQRAEGGAADYHVPLDTSTPSGSGYFRDNQSPPHSSYRSDQYGPVTRHSVDVGAGNIFGKGYVDTGVSGPKNFSLQGGYRRQFADGGEVHAGPILSSVPGRTDNHPMDVEEGAYILPADHVSSLGEGNTMAGMQVVNHMIESLGADPRHRGDGDPVPINAAGGEVAIPPAVVMAIGGGDIKRGHEMLDQWVLMNRRKHISTLRNLPGPAKS